MRTVVAIKEKKAILGNVCMMLLTLFLCILCILRAISSKYRIYTRIIIGALALCAFYYFIKEIILLIKSIQLPKEQIFIENDNIIFYDKKQYTKKALHEIEKVEISSLKNDSFLFYQASIILRTSNKSYVISQIKNVEKVKEELENYLKK